MVLTYKQHGVFATSLTIFALMDHLFIYIQCNYVVGVEPLSFYLLFIFPSYSVGLLSSLLGYF